MKNVKILLLLGVMLVNVMPYLKDGKVEWKAAQVEAQIYTIEFDTNLNKYLCWDPSLFGSNPFYYSDTDCEINSDPTDESENCNANGFNRNLQIAGVIPTTAYAEAGQGWCAFLTIASITGNTPCDVARYYYQYYKPWIEDYCTATDGVSSMEGFWFAAGHFGLHCIDRSGCYDACNVVQKIDCNGKGLIATNGSHIFVYYKFEATDNNPENIDVTKYDTADPKGWNRTIKLKDMVTSNAVVQH